MFSKFLLILDPELGSKALDEGGGGWGGLAPPTFPTVSAKIFSLYVCEIFCCT